LDPTVNCILFTIAAYLVGSIPVGLIIGQVWAGIDIREYGSRNIGMTNVYRTMVDTHGHLPWVMTLVLDFAKGYLPIHLALRWLSNGNEPNPLFSYYITLVVLAVLLGNLYPIYIYFRGGKGIATGLGIFTALIGVYMLIPLGVFLLFFLPSGIVSLGSITAAISLPITFYIIGRNRWGVFGTENPDFPPLSPTIFVVITTVVAIIVIFKHRANIARLMAGEERRLWSRKKTQEAVVIETMDDTETEEIPDIDE